MALRIGELVGVLRADASAWERGLDRAQLRLAGLQRDTAGRLRDMNGQFVRGGRRAGRSFASRMLSTMGRTMRRGAAGALRLGMSGIGKAAKSTPWVKAAGLAIGVAMLPAIGAALASAVISVAGIGVIGLGAMILKDEPEVKKAAKSLKKTVGDILKKAAQPMKGALVKAMGALEQTAKDVAPSLKRVFEAASPLIKPLTDGFDALVKNMLPGFISMMEDAKPTFEGLKELMSDVGEGLSGFFREIGKAAPETKIFLQDLGGLLKQILIGAGKFIAWLSKVYVKVRDFYRPVNETVNAVVGLFKWLWDTLVGHSIIPDIVNGIVMWFAKLPGKILGKLADFVTKVKDKFVQLKDKAVAKVRELVAGAVRWLQGMPGRAYRALSSLGPNLASRAWDAGRRLVGAIRNKIGDAVRYVRGLPGRAARALWGIGSRLYSSGRSLIGGFISGIWSRISDVANAAASVVSRARDFFPFSPAKEGAFSGKGWTLYSGRSLIDGFRQGIEQQLPGLRSQLGMLGDGMPALGMAGGGIGMAGGRGGTAAARPLQVHLLIGGREFGQLWIDTGRQEVSARGGNVQAVVGQR